MTRNSMGQFMAALRKANGMTQQEVADRLGVSNKAISRWERDECAPDIVLIPALAELYGVTCDELLRGERRTEAVAVQESGVAKNDKKAEKQLKSLVNRTLSRFKTQMWIALALAVSGGVCMFGISWVFYRYGVGFAVLLLFEIVAFVLTMVAINKVKEAKTENELLEQAGDEVLRKLNYSLGTESFRVFLVIGVVVLLAFPELFRNVLECLIPSLLLEICMLIYWVLVGVTALLVHCFVKPIYVERMTGEKVPIADKN